MNTYNGIPMSELRLVVSTTIMTILFIGVAVAMGFFLYSCVTMKSAKERRALIKLRKKARNDDTARNKLEKIKRRNKRRRQRNKSDIVADVVCCGLLICVAIAALVWTIIPGWIDYFKKDYVVYTGEIKVYSQMKHSRIELEDGTTVLGKGDFDEDDTYGTVVYSKRTKQYIGGRN